MFRLLKLKPPHGWNAVMWELAIVTLGVVVALAAQELAGALHDRSVAKSTRAQVSEELNSDLMSMELRRSSEPCIDRRIDELRAILLRWQQTGSFPAPSWVAQAPVIEVETSRYESAVSAGRLALLSGEEQYRIGALVNRIRQFNDWQFKERLIWGRLRALQQGPQALSAIDRAELRTALQDASAIDYEIKVATSQTLPMASRYGFAPDPKGFRELAPQVWPGGKFTPSICASIDTPPEEANRRVMVPLPL